MRKHILVSMTAILVLALATIAMAADPFVGTWRLNPANSNLPPIQEKNLKSFIFKVENENGRVRASNKIVNADGSITHSEWLGQFDGKDYPITGTPIYDMTSMKKMDARTLEKVGKLAGKEVDRWRLVVSKDNKLLTCTTKLKAPNGQDISITLVFDRQ